MKKIDNIILIGVVVLLIIIIAILTNSITNLIAFSIVILFGYCIVIKMPDFFEKHEKKKAEKYYGYKIDVIKELVKGAYDTLDYYPQYGINMHTYREAGFEQFEGFSSQDLIKGTILDNKKVLMSHVLIRKDKKYDVDLEAMVTYVTLFDGLFAYIDLGTQTDLSFKITKNKILSDKIKKDGKIDMDSAQFEKIYDIKADDRIEMLRLFTADVMQLLIDFKNENDVVPEMVFKDNKLYIRFSVGNIFEPNKMGKNIEYDRLKKIYDFINFVFKFTEDFSKNLLEFDQ